MKILVCDTSNQTCCAGIFEDGRELAYRLSFETKTHSETFMPLVDEVMKEAGIKYSDIDVYAVTTGPGSFTGIRIGLSAVKGMALATGAKCIGLSSTESLARSCDNATLTPKEETIIIPSFDARNNRVFAKVEEDDTHKTLVKEDAYDANDLALEVTKLPEVVYNARKQILVVGSGANVMKKAFEEIGAGLNVYYAPGAAIMPKGIAALAFDRLSKEAPVSARDITANYCAASRVKTLKQQQDEKNSKN
ncbi:MAG: tRNA (adenosine(37)-N6)-threonylcarbamoyltransferase complex dimerization subunit type 1 TsaB [Saccharofermentans sp.]|nr:tRNA (adenosine(37)-N6)-threonylcarbamoyltransferase complex dimerization subunit type 1 TsaB [Saccharofermentans sp.]